MKLESASVVYGKRLDCTGGDHWCSTWHENGVFGGRDEGERMVVEH